MNNLLEIEKFLLEWLKNTPFNNNVFATGGYVRDSILNKYSKDLDIVVNKHNGAKDFSYYLHNQFINETTNPYELGAGYPIWHIVFKQNIFFNNIIFKVINAEIDIADTQKESFLDINSRQRITDFGTLEEDAYRRDFSVNSLYKNLSNGEYIDITGISKHDIEIGILRGNPGISLDKIFSDDPLRMVRLCVFYARYNWKIPFSVLKAVKRNAERIKIVSTERIMAEFIKAMKIGKLYLVIKLMKITKLLKYILPEIENLIGVTQPKQYHAEGDCWNHTLLVLKNAPATIEGQLAALLHDVAKPVTREEADGKIRFPKHDDVGSEMADVILHRLKFDSGVIEQVKLMIKNHMRAHHLGDAGNKAMRKFLRDVGEEMASKILDLGEADAKGSIPNTNDIPKTREKMEAVKNSPIKVSRKPVLNGLEIMDVLKIKPGAKVGEAGKFLIELEDDLAENDIALTKEIAIQKLLEKFA